MTSTTLYFVRHGETDYNRRRIMQGRRIDAELNATGYAQAEALAQRFAEVPLEAVYSSTLKRAAATADAIAARHPDAPRHRLADLDEMSWGIYEGEPVTEVIEPVFKEMYAQWERGVFDHRVEDGESILDVQARALQAVDHIVAHHPGETVAVVTHGRFLRVLLASLLEAYGLKRMQEIQHANTAVNRITYRDGRFEADLLNCTAHLDHVETIMVE